MLRKLSSLRIYKTSSLLRALSSQNPPKSDVLPNAVGDKSDKYQSEEAVSESSRNEETHDIATTENVHSKIAKMSPEELKVWKHDNEERGGGPGNSYVPDLVDKWIMVIGGAYPSLSSVPNVVRPAAYERARQKTNIYLNMCALLTVLAFMMFLHQSFRRDQEFAEKYQIDLAEDDARRKIRHAEERELRAKRRKLIEDNKVL